MSIKKTTIKDILDSFKVDIKKISNIYKGMELTKLSFMNDLNKLKFYNDYTLNKKVAYISLSDKNNYNFTAFA